ncbi:120.7 kDa protein in NOF-FB transposable element, partial [Camponotus floridanus]
SDIIYDHIWNQLKFPCAFNFKNAKVNRTLGEIFLQIKGKCSECHIEINIYGTDESTFEGIRLQISTYDTWDVTHAKKRQLRGNERKSVVEILAKSTYTWRRDKANELMKFDDVKPANLYSEDVLRKTKQLHRDEELGVLKIIIKYL